MTAEQLIAIAGVILLGSSRLLERRSPSPATGKVANSGKLDEIILKIEALGLKMAGGLQAF